MNHRLLPIALASALLLAACGPTKPKNPNLNENVVGEALVMGRTGCERTLKGLLRDPNSLEEEEYVITEASPSSWTARMAFRSRNGFGGMNRGVASCSFDGEQYQVRILEGE